MSAWRNKTLIIGTQVSRRVLVEENPEFAKLLRPARDKGNQSSLQLPCRLKLSAALTLF